MGQGVVRLPSGAAVEMRGLTIREENVLAKARSAPPDAQERALVGVIAACTVRLADHGPYPPSPAGDAAPFDWMGALQGDFYGAMIGLSGITYPDGQRHEFQARHGAAWCTRVGTYAIDLQTDLVVQPLPPEAAACLAGKLIEIQIAGTVVRFGLPVVRDSERVAKLQAQYPDRTMSALLRSRIVEVEGVDPKDIMDWLDGGRGGRFEPLSSADTELLRDAFDRWNCGIDNEVVVQCQHCGQEFTATVPFDHGLLLPGRGIEQRRRERRRGMACSA